MAKSTKKSGQTTKDSDPHFAAILTTAAAVDELNSKLDVLLRTTEETRQNAIVLAAQQEVTAGDVKELQRSSKRVEDKVDSVLSSLEELRIALAGTSSLAKSALDQAVSRPRRIKSA